jgi:hypothetical protein
MITDDAQIREHGSRDARATLTLALSLAYTLALSLELTLGFTLAVHAGAVTGNMSDHSIYLRVSGVYVHEKCCLGTPYLCGAWKVPVWPRA